MDKPTVLTPEQLNRLHRIWATDLDGCARKTYHRVLDTPRLQSHYYSYRGSKIHKVLEESVNIPAYDDETIEPDHPFIEIPEYETSQLENEIVNILDNYRIWLSETEIDLGDSEAEVKYERELAHGYVMVRKVDLLTPTHGIDFKSGKPNYNMSSRYEVVLGAQMVYEAEGREVEPVIVFLGGDRPVERSPYTKSLDKDEISERLEQAIDLEIATREMIRTGSIPPCKLSFTCAFCAWRHKCNGV